MYYYFSRIKKIQPSLENVHFIFGSVFHKCMEGYYGGDKLIILLKYIDKIYNRKIKQSMVPPWYTEALQEHRCKVRAMVRSYVKFNKRKTYQTICLEKELRNYKIAPNIKIWLKIDRVIKDGDNMWAVEYKTTSSLDPEFIKSEKLDYQGSIYVDACRRALKINVKGIRYEIIRKPANRIKKNESYIDYEERMYEDMISRKDEFFMFLEAKRDQKSLEMCRQDVVKIAKSIQLAEDNDLYYRNTTSCKRYGKCPFLELELEGWTPRTKRLYKRKEFRR